MTDVLLPDELTNEENGFLAQAAHVGVLVFRPHEIPIIESLIDRGYLDSEADRDPDYELLFLTNPGREAVAVFRDSSGVTRW